MTLNLDLLPPHERIELDQLLGGLVWLPHPDNRPQIDAFFSPAFETLYGGAAGGGKSDLLLGLARTMHGRSLLLRRSFPDLERSLISRSLEFFGDSAYYNATKHLWNVDGRRIEFGHMETIGTPHVPKDEAQYASAPYDLIGFDQLEQFIAYAYEFMFSRARSAGGRRVRIVSTCNFVGIGVDWILHRWRAWLVDKTAKPGELRWYKRDADGNDVETTADDPDGVSRTYIPALLSDNPYLGEGYRKVLNALPEPIRSALLKGDPSAMLTDDAYQVIPRAWVRAAMARWTDKPPESEKEKPLVVGCDVARGGEDKTVLAPRRGRWFDKLSKYPGRVTTDGQSVVALMALFGKGNFNVDVIGIGSSVYDLSKGKMNVSPINFAEGSDATDKSGQLTFINKRAECYWKFREALDPVSGEDLMLPPDPELEADLCAPRWVMQTNGIKIESKEEIKKRLGRSPDCSDGVVLAKAQGIIPLPKSQPKQKPKYEREGAFKRY